MWRHIARRLLQMIPLVLLISAIVFVLTHILPGDVAMAILGEEMARDDVAYEAVRAELGLDHPLHLQYMRWLARTVRGDFGTSYRTHEDVGSALAQRLPRTLQLMVMATMLSTAIAIPVGVLSALRPNSKLDMGGTLFAMFGVAVPNFWLGLMLIFLFAFAFGFFPGTGYVSPTEDLGRNLKVMMLPALTLGMSGTATLMRLTRSSMLEVLQQDYIRTAHAKGLRPATVLVIHALKNALIPVVTVYALQIGDMFGGSVVVETVFRIPGMGFWAAQSVFFRDLAATQAIIMVTATAVVISNLAADILYAYLDPRIRIA